MMNTGTTWHPPTLQKELDSTPDFAHGLSIINPIKGSDEFKVECQCGCWCWPFQMIDVRSVAGIAADFACDGCMTKFERNLDDVDGTGKSKTKEEFRKKLLTIFNAPQAMIDKVGVRNDEAGEYRTVEINNVFRAVRGNSITHAQILDETGLPANTVFKVKMPGEEFPVDLAEGQSTEVVPGMKVNSGN